MSQTDQKLSEQKQGAADGCRTILALSMECAVTPVVRVLTACVHEHVTEQLVCSKHLREGLSGRIKCAQCQRIDGHDCPKSFMEMS